MKKIRKKIITSVVVLLLIPVLYVGGTLLHGTLTDYQPQTLIPLEIENTKNASKIALEDSIFTFLLWNVGYGGLGAESNFFYDSGGFLTSNGKMVRTSKVNVEKNIQGALNLLSKKEADFYLLQEVDANSKRSYFINQYKKYQSTLDEYSSTFATNYKSQRVPLPVLEPWKVMGKVHSGLGTFARFTPSKATRYQLPGTYDWPTRIFQLDRCAAFHRFPLADSSELIVVNVHNSAYDDGSIKEQQMAFLKEKLLAEYQAGNYVVVGGDWNQCPPNFDYAKFSKKNADDYSQIPIEEDFMPDWTWVYDESIPTNRKLTDSYVPNETFRTLIDFFLVSPNIEVLNTQGIDQNFEFSDHQPVLLKAKLK